MHKEVIKPLRIAVIGYNYEQTRMALESFILNNKEDIIDIKKYRSTVVLIDRTELSIVNDITDIVGNNYDQLMVCDDYRWNVFEKKELLINAVVSSMKYYSCVPEEFQVMRYEI